MGSVLGIGPVAESPQSNAAHAGWATAWPKCRNAAAGDSAHLPGRTAAERPGSDSQPGATRVCRGCARGCAGLPLSMPRPRSKPHDSLDFPANAGLRGSESRISDTPTQPHDTPTRAVLPPARPAPVGTFTPAYTRDSPETPRIAGLPTRVYPGKPTPAYTRAETRDAPDGTHPGRLPRNRRRMWSVALPCGDVQQQRRASGLQPVSGSTRALQPQGPYPLRMLGRACSTCDE